MRTLFISFIALLLAGCNGGSGRSSAPANSAPTISAIADLSGQVNQTLETDLTVSDDLTPANQLTIVVTASNPEVIDTVRVERTGNAQNLVITPVLDAAGSATLNVLVTDRGGLSNETVFTVSFERINTRFDSLLQSVLAQPADSVPVTINQFSIAPVEVSFNNLIAELGSDV